MALKFFKKLSLPKLIGRYGVLAVDTFSTLIFFMLLGASWVLATTGGIFALVKIWHWQESWKTDDKFRKLLHRGTWLILAVLSIYFLITLGLSITQTPEEVQVNENVVALEEAVALSRIANVQSLIREQEMLLTQNGNLAERMVSLNQWSDAFKPLQAQMNANLDRLGAIAVELNRISSEQSTESKEQLETEQTESGKLIKFQAVKPIGAPSLMGRVVPAKWVNISIILLFTLIGIVMEITMALSSLPAEEIAEPKKVEDKDYVPACIDEEAIKEQAAKEQPQTFDFIEVINSVKEGRSPVPVQDEESQIQNEAPVERLEQAAAEEQTGKIEGDPLSAVLNENDPKGLTKKKRERKGYNIEEIQKYIEIACQDDGSFIPHNQIAKEDFSSADCSGIRAYLKSLRFKGKPIIELSNGVYKTELGKEKLKKLITLQAGS